MKTYQMAKPCAACPFLIEHAASYGPDRLREFAAGAFPCHETAKLKRGGFVWSKNSRLCAGALIFNIKRGEYTQVMQVLERLGLYDPAALTDADRIV